MLPCRRSVTFEAGCQRIGQHRLLADSGGELLAASTAEPSFHLDASRSDYRVKTAESSNPILRAVGERIRGTAAAVGNHFITVNGTRQLARWWTYQLPNGPELTMGVVSAREPVQYAAAWRIAQCGLADTGCVVGIRSVRVLRH